MAGPFFDYHTEIVKRLKTHAEPAYQRVIKYGDSIPTAPYIVVKEEYSQLTRRQVFRIIAHFNKGQSEFMKHYIKVGVYALLKGFKITNSVSEVKTVVECQNRDLGELPVSSDDATISREAVYYVPDSMQIAT
jgi:hypothetical protein